jgi:hypothetical protein
LTEDDLKKFEEMQVSQREEAHGLLAVETGRACNVFNGDSAKWEIDGKKVGAAIGGNQERLNMWQEEMAQDVLLHGKTNEVEFADVVSNEADIICQDRATSEVDVPEVEPIEHLTTSEAEVLAPLELNKLNRD